MRNFTDDFLKLKDKRFVLYGAGFASSKVFEYLKAHGFADDRIVCFIDRDISKQGKRLCDRDIKPPAYLLEHPEFVIVICSQYHKSIMSDLKAMGASHQVYAYMHFVPCYSSQSNDYSLQELLSNYDDDPYTKNILETCLHFRQPDNCKIQPIEQAIYYTGSERYWHDEDMPTLDYNELTVLDGGAYTGDTFKLLYEKYGERIKRYYAFEPDRKTAEKLRQNIGNTAQSVDVKILEYGLSDTQETVSFESNDSHSFLSHIAADGGGASVQLMPIDDLNIQVEGKLCIKMDIESSELKALKGASETISRYLPDMAVCVYHLADDIYKIPHFIKSLTKKYRCIIRGGIHMACFAHYEE